MKYKVFVDTNILLSGIFFEGNESSILACLAGQVFFPCLCLFGL
jgi:hypothetical protein